MSKFANKNDELLYQMSLEGADDEIGSVQELGWYGMFKDLERPPFPEPFAILKQDEQGFVDVRWFSNKAAMDSAWTTIQDDYADFYVSDGEETW